jgi:hypothetical protein
MLSFSGALRVFVALDPCDMRKGFNGLHALVTERLAEDPRGGPPGDTHGTKVAVRADRLASESCFNAALKHCLKALEDHQRTFGSEQSRHLKVDSPDRSARFLTNDLTEQLITLRSAG